MERLSLHGKSSGESFQQSAEDDLIISNALDTDDGDSCVHEEDHGEEHWQDVDDGETSGSHAIAPLGMMGRTRNGFAKNKMPMRVEKVFSILDCDEETGFRRRARSLTGPSPVYNFGPKARTMKNSAGLMSIQDPASLRLTWYKTPFSVLVIKKIYDEDIIRPFVEIISHLVKERRMMVYVEEAILKDVKLSSNEDFDRLKDKLYTVSEGQDDLTDKIDFILCLGGDGTLLHASSLFQTSVPPVLAFHLGSLGFLTIFEYAENFKSVLTSVLEGNAKLSLRSRLKCAITKVDSDLSRIPVKNLQASHQKSMMVLNEVVIDRGPSPYLTNLDLYVEGRYVTSVQGDGLIISTPTGSTAYAVSAGASLVHPSVPAIMITPICPHSLSFRPIVLPAGVEIKVMVSPEARSTAWVSYDGRNRHELAHGELLRVATAIYPVPCICRDDQIMDWFDCLGTCMHWNVRHRQKPFIGIGNGMTPSSSSNSLCSRNSGSDTNCDNSY